MEKTVLICSASYCKFTDEPLKMMEAAGLKLVRDNSLKTYETWSQAQRDAVVAIVCAVEPINDYVLDLLPNVEMVVKTGAGLDNIDQEATSRRGIAVRSAAGANASAVAELTIGLLVAVTRGFVRSDRDIRNKVWGRYFGVELSGKTLAVIGYGAIGQQVAQRAKCLGMKIIAYDAMPRKDLDVQYVDLETALREGDFITLHAPLLPETHHLIRRETIELMKDGVYILNVARGGIVNELDLVEAIKSGKVAGAALDVFENEPNVRQELLDCDQVILTGHIAGFTKEALNKIAMTNANQIIDHFKK